MKITIKDDDGQSVDVGYDWFDSWEFDGKDLLFWIETKRETVTLALKPQGLDNLISTLQYLRNKIEPRN